MNSLRSDAPIGREIEFLAPDGSRDLRTVWHVAPSATYLGAAGTAPTAGDASEHKVGEALGAATGASNAGGAGSVAGRSEPRLLAIIDLANTAESALKETPVLTSSAKVRSSVAGVWTWYNSLLTESIDACLVDSLGSYVNALFDVCSRLNGNRCAVRDYAKAMIQSKYQALGFDVERDFEKLEELLANIPLTSGRELVRGVKLTVAEDVTPTQCYRRMIARMRATNASWVAAELSDSVEEMCCTAASTQSDITYDPQGGAAGSAESAVTAIVNHCHEKYSLEPVRVVQALDLSSFSRSMTNDISEWMYDEFEAIYGVTKEAE